MKYIDKNCQFKYEAKEAQKMTCAQNKEGPQKYEERRLATDKVKFGEIIEKL